MPMALSMSRDQARPSPAIFLSVICCNGLKWPASKVRPLRSQLFPVAASDMTRASFTSPGFALLSAEERSAIATPIATMMRVRPRMRRGFMPNRLSNEPPKIRRADARPVVPI